MSKELKIGNLYAVHYNHEIRILGQKDDAIKKWTTDKRIMILDEIHESEDKTGRKSYYVFNGGNSIEKKDILDFKEII